MRLSATDMSRDYSVGEFAIEVALSNDRSWPFSAGRAKDSLDRIQPLTHQGASERNVDFQDQT